MTTRAGSLAMHVADRHVERWAPETTAHKSRPLRNLSFVDRTISPWIETAQRSASLRMFTQMRMDGFGERAPSNVSWVFPRPWYQDELDWMAAARQAPAMGAAPAATMFTTRGTYVTPDQQSAAALPAALYEYIAPSLSVAAPMTDAAGIGFGGSQPAYSPLVPLAAVQAAEVMQRAVAPVAAMPAPATRAPALRNVLAIILERAARAPEPMPSRISQQAPELVTPSLPAAGRGESREGFEPRNETLETLQLAQHYAEQRAQIAEVQRVARVAAEREMAARVEHARAQLAAQTTAPATAVSPELRDATARVEAELRARTQAPESARVAPVASAPPPESAPTDDVARAEIAVRTEVARAQEAAERAERTRIEERVAQRLAERTAARTLHEQARAEAAAHARVEAERAMTAVAVAEAAAVAPPPVRAANRPPAEVTAALAALPPELTQFIGQRPGGALAAIDELTEALRTVELLSHAAASGQSFATTRGPRLVMPAGLGGLVTAIDQAQTIVEQPAAMGGMRRPPLPLAVQPDAMAGAQRAAAAARVPSMAFLSSPTARTIHDAGRERSTNALDAAIGAKPAALAHVAWADRWLARFAGASQHSLDTLTAASALAPESRYAALAAAAPGSVFVAPVFDIERAGEAVAPRALPAIASPAMPAPAAPTMQRIEQPEVVRYADDAETPDDVFAAIAAGVALTRQAATPSAAAPSTASSEPSYIPPPYAIERYTPADLVAHSAPAAPGAGFSAQLASSPFAPALRHVLPLPSAPSFDVRALFGGGLSATYLAGLLAPATDEVELGAGMLPSWAQAFASEAFAGEAAEAFAMERSVPAFDAPYVAPAFDDIAPETFVGGADEAAVANAPAVAAARAQLEAARAQLEAVTAPLTTLRSALLSWDVEETPAGLSFVPSTEMSMVSHATSSPITATTARTMLEAMSLPMLGDTVDREEIAAGAAWTSPGMVADRAHAWSVAQERSSADLAFDFVPPELVLAARVYGLGPAEAAQAARLALAGPGHLTAMAGTVDRTFVQAMTLEAERRERVAAMSAASTAGATPFALPPAFDDAAPAITPASLGLTQGAFGVDRKAPRGAFLWPSATVAALGLNAAAPDGQQSMSVAALELLAAQAVAELGTFTAMSDQAWSPDGEDAAEAAAASATPVPSIARGAASTPAAAGAEPSESDVLDSVTSLVPASRRGRFEALYLALSQSPSSASWSPAARAARALAIAGRGEDGAVSARERAAFAWDVLPVVYAESLSQFGGAATAAAFGADGADGGATASDGTPSFERRRGLPASAQRKSIGGREYVAVDDIAVDGRPGLSALSARAGEALGSYVAPVGAAPAANGASASSSSSSSSSSTQAPGVYQRAPSAAQELVRTGRPSGRYGGGETEIPSWFEQAARKMLAERHSASDGISLAELTLVTAAPASAVAASSRGMPSAAPLAPAHDQMDERVKEDEADADIDVEKVAGDVYRHILDMMDLARARNGDSYL